MTEILIILCIVLCISMLLLLFYFRNRIDRLGKESERNFKLMAAESLETNARALQQSNCERLDALLTPLRIRLEDFNREIEKTNTDSEVSRRSLAEQIDRLTRLNLTIGEDARNLASALRGNNRVQGQWGETILESLLEKAGLKKGDNYETQVTRNASGTALRDEEGHALRPDMIIHLPNERDIVVDSKTSLSAYLDFCEAESDTDSKEAIKRHLTSIKRHIDELASRNYPKSIPGAAELTLMFIPNDGALTAALNADNTLTSYAFDHKVVLVSPTLLMGMIMLIGQLWRKEAQDRNAAEIARLGGLLYDTAKDFMSDLQGVEKSLHAAQKSYESALARLTSGSRSFLARAERLRDLGAKTTK